jgi:hypothetical protein
MKVFGLSLAHLLGGACHQNRSSTRRVDCLAYGNMGFKISLSKGLLRWSLYGKVGVVCSRSSDDDGTDDNLDDDPCFDYVCRFLFVSRSTVCGRVP